MWVDASKAVLVVVTAVDAYFGVLGNVTPFWVPLAILATMFAVFVRIPWWTTPAQQAKIDAYKQQYINEIWGKNNQPIDKDKMN